jgi:hypothetical protein
MGEQITGMKARPAETLARMSTEMYRVAYKKGMSLSAHLEEEDPSEGYNDGLDAFQRLLKVAGIRTQSIPELGIWSNAFEDLSEHPQARLLVPEFVSRCARRASAGRDVMQRTLYTSSDTVPGGAMFPLALAAQARYKQIAPAIPLSELVAITTPVNAGVYQAFYLTEVAASMRKVRVSEGAPLPPAKLTGGEHTINLYKYGRSLEVSYEVLRRQRIDQVALYIGLLAIQSESDKVAAALDVLVSGDGNSNAATIHTLTSLDSSASAGTMTLKGWLAFKMKFTNPYVCMAVLCQEAVALQLLTLNMGSANVPLVNVAAPSGMGMFRAINPGLSDNVALGWTSDAPSLKIVGIDTRFALERVYEVNSEIQEIERYATRQTQALTFSEVEGYAIFDPYARLVLNVNA